MNVVTVIMPQNIMNNIIIKKNNRQSMRNVSKIELYTYILNESIIIFSWFRKDQNSITI